MQWLNYHHLLYFWVVAREGSIARATKKLRLAEPTISAQIRRLEHVLGRKLFERTGRRLVLTEYGRLACRYADQIFSLGREFMEVWNGRAVNRPARFRVGVTGALPKAIVRRILEPALRAEMPVQLECRAERDPEELIGQLVAHALDVVLSDAPAPPRKEKVFNHRLGLSGTTVFGATGLGRRFRSGFPRSLDGAPFLMTGARSARRQSLHQWFSEHGLSPVVVAEIDDNALLMELGRDGAGLFAGPSILESEIRGHYGVLVVGRLPEVLQQFFAITAERRVIHPAILATCEAVCGQIVATRSTAEAGAAQR